MAETEASISYLVDGRYLRLVRASLDVSHAAVHLYFSFFVSERKKNNDFRERKLTTDELDVGVVSTRAKDPRDIETTIITETELKEAVRVGDTTVADPFER